MCDPITSDDEGIHFRTKNSPPLKELFSKMKFFADSCLLLDYSSKLSCSEQQSKSLSSNDNRSLPLYSLQHEFSLLNTNIPHIDVEVLDAIKRHAMIRVSANGVIIMLQVVFPESYPSPDSVPDFIYCQGTTIDDNLAESLVKVLKATASHRIKRGRTCLEQCLRALVSSLKKVFVTGWLMVENQLYLKQNNNQLLFSREIYCK